MSPDTFPTHLICACKPGFEGLLQRELATANVQGRIDGLGVVTAGDLDMPASAIEAPVHRLCFPFLTLYDPQEFQASSVNALAGQLLEHFLRSARDERTAALWPCVFLGPASTSLAKRARHTETRWRALLQRKMSRVEGLADNSTPANTACRARGYFVYFADFHKAYATCWAQSGGQCRMRMDAAAPSRSFLKIEEAYRVLGREPASGETVIDLGAAPGGWSYSAARRGAKVLAIDSATFKAPASPGLSIVHRGDNAYHVQPPRGERYDWLFCDLVDEPFTVLRLVRRWLEKKWCRWMVVNLKIGHADPIELLQTINDSCRGLRSLCFSLTVRHLYHDRDEITLMGETV